MALPILNPNNNLPDDVEYVIPHPPSITMQNGPYDAFTTLADVRLAMDRQFQILNDLFQSSPFVFDWQNRNDPTISTNVNYTHFPLDYMTDMSREYGHYNNNNNTTTNPLSTLHVYVSFTLRSQDVPETNTFVGYSTFPSYQFDGQQQHRRFGSAAAGGDGVYVTYTALPIDTDDGSILVHEVGHWLGLYHTFQNGCDTDNDFVVDTPAHADSTAVLFPNATCTDFVQHPVDTCTNGPGTDPVYNIMNYLADRSCLGTHAQFTCGQIERMVQQWYLYRDTTDQCSTNNNDSNNTSATTSHHLEIFMLFDKLHYFETNWVLTRIDDGTILFDSVKDFANFEVPLLQDELYVDLCLEAGVYEFTVTDSSQNGFFGDAYLDITLDGVLIQKIMGNFGGQSTTSIYAGISETIVPSSSVIPVPTATSSSPETSLPTPLPSIVSLPANLESNNTTSPKPTSVSPTISPSLEKSQSHATTDGWKSIMPTSMSSPNNNNNASDIPTRVPIDWRVVPVHQNDGVVASSEASSSFFLPFATAPSFAVVVLLALWSS
jgi:hypothetical protein